MPLSEVKAKPVDGGGEALSMPPGEPQSYLARYGLADSDQPDQLVWAMVYDEVEVYPAGGDGGGPAQRGRNVVVFDAVSGRGLVIVVESSSS